MYKLFILRFLYLKKNYCQNYQNKPFPSQMNIQRSVVFVRTFFVRNNQVSIHICKYIFLSDVTENKQSYEYIASYNAFP
jgi:hypothetical protein